MPTRFSGAAWARGVGWLGGSSGAQGGLTSALHPLVPGRCLRSIFGMFLDEFLWFSAHPLATTRKKLWLCMAVWQ